MIQRFERCLPEEVGIPSEAIDAFLMSWKTAALPRCTA